MKIKTLTTGVGVETSHNLDYLPQFLFYVAATQLSGLLVTIEGDGVLKNLGAAAGLTFDANIGAVSRVTNGYQIQLADGLVTGKNVTMKFTNSAVQTPDVFAYSLNEGAQYVVSSSQVAQAGSGVTISKFAYAGFPSAAAADIFNVTWSDGTVQQMAREELQALLGAEQAIGNAADDYKLLNLDQSLSRVNFVPVAEQTYYVSRFVPVGAFNI